MDAERLAAGRRVILLATTPLTLGFALLAGYAVMSCRALEPFSWQWSLLLAFPAGTVGATVGVMHSVMSRNERAGLLALIAAVGTIVAWMDLAFGRVF